MVKSKPSIIVVVGPTASGKSDLAIALAQQFDGEVISADSRQVYRGLDIGTGKVSKREQRLVKHWLIDLVSPKKKFSVAEFKSLAKQAIADVQRRKKVPILCGGTGLYIDTVIYDLSFPEVPAKPKLRAELEKLSAEQLFAQLKTLDRGRAKTIDEKNKVRLIRAIEIAQTLGSVPALDTHYTNHASQYDVLWLGLNPKDLEQRIAQRLQKRFRHGMVAEVKHLRTTVSHQRLREIGLVYRIIPDFLDKKISAAEMKKLVLTAELQYAKRQMTWFKRNKSIRWVADAFEAKRLCREFLH